jgi:hypothetical protein
MFMGNDMRLAMVFLALFSLAHGLTTPQAYPMFPTPVSNQTSTIYCGFVNSTVGEKSNITANITYANGTSIWNGSLNNTAANNQTAILTYDFPTETEGSNVLVVCRFQPQNIFAYSIVQTIHPSGFGTTSNDNLTLGTLIGLSILVVIFIYLHINAKGSLWAEFWMFLASLITIADLLSMLSFANDEGANGIANVALALFIGFFGVFLLTLYLFFWDLILLAIKGINEAYNGTRK